MKTALLFSVTLFSPHPYPHIPPHAHARTHTHTHARTHALTYTHTRTHTGEVEEYELPYFDVVSNDPSFDEMKKVVAVQEIRPGIVQRWKDDEVCARVCAYKYILVCVFSR